MRLFPCLCLLWSCRHWSWISADLPLPCGRGGGYCSDGDDGDCVGSGGDDDDGDYGPLLLDGPHRWLTVEKCCRRGSSKQCLCLAGEQAIV